MTEYLNVKEYIRKLINIAYINIGIPLLFFLWVYLEYSSERMLPMIESETILFVFFALLVLAVAMVFFGQRKFKQLIGKSLELKQLYGKLVLYQKGLTIRFVCYALVSMAIAIGFYLTGYQPFTVLFGGMIVLFSVHSPNARRVAIDLKLEKEDRISILEGRDIPKDQS